MTEKRVRNIRSVAFALLLAVLIFAGSYPAAAAFPVAPTERMTVVATRDTYTDIHLPETNFDEGLLNVANSPGLLEQPDVTTKRVYVAFDLGGVGFEIKCATLRLSTLSCGGLVAVDVADVAVYGVNNDAIWTEETLTWDIQPQPSTGALAHLDAGATVFDLTETYTWTDRGQGQLAAWLESQRGANDGSATLMLVIENADDPGLADLFFEDREGTGAAYGCADSLGGPALEVGSAVGDHTIYLPLVTR